MLPFLHQTSIGKSLGSNEDEAILVGAIAGAASCCCCCCRRKKRTHKNTSIY